MASVPASLKSVVPFLKHAKDIKSAEPVVAYHTMFYALELAMKLGGRDPEAKGFLLSLMDEVESDKRAIGTVEDAKVRCEIFAQEVFDRADKHDREGLANAWTAKTFQTASKFFEVCQQFGELDEDLAEKHKYAKWKALDIAKAIKAGRKPVPGPPGGEPEPMDVGGGDHQDQEHQHQQQQQHGSGDQGQPNPEVSSFQQDFMSFGQQNNNGHSQPPPQSQDFMSFGQPQQPPQSHTYSGGEPSMPSLGNTDDIMAALSGLNSMAPVPTHAPDAKSGGSGGGGAGGTDDILSVLSALNSMAPVPTHAPSQNTGGPPPDPCVAIYPPSRPQPPPNPQIPVIPPTSSQSPQTPQQPYPPQQPQPPFPSTQQKLQPAAHAPPATSYQPAAAPIRPVGIATTQNYSNITDKQILDAQKKCKFAVNALNFEDVPAAVEYIRQALADLNALA